MDLIQRAAACRGGPGRNRAAWWRGARPVAWAIASLAALAGPPTPAAAQDKLAVPIAYVTREEGAKLRPLSLLEPRELPDEGLAGATLALKDNQTTGGFLGHDYTLSELVVPEDSDLAAAVRELLAAGERFFIADLPQEDLLALADLPEAAGAIIFNGRAQDDVLRTDECRANVFHTVPSRAMKADALAQFLVWKRWNRWFLIQGERPDDIAFADALRRSGAKFNGKIVEERTYAYEPTARVTETGHVQVQRQMRVFTQDAPDHDVLLVADESDVFGEYLPYQTWDPRPVAGTQGLVPTAWHRSHEQWAGTQMQNRFEEHAGRWMRERDYTAWLGVRALGEAVTRTNSNDPKVLRDYLRGEQFELGAFKGEGLTFRSWNQQMRQPILLAAARILVSVSPQEGFLHQRTPLDSLGFDQPESNCRLE
jgi:ABC transporter substrate binding protein (PQQ-dependent alcohol dehydrogenase system)